MYSTCAFCTRSLFSPLLLLSAVCPDSDASERLVTAARCSDRKSSLRSCAIRTGSGRRRRQYPPCPSSPPPPDFFVVDEDELGQSGVAPNGVDQPIHLVIAADVVGRQVQTSHRHVASQDRHHLPHPWHRDPVVAQVQVPQRSVSLQRLCHVCQRHVPHVVVRQAQTRQAAVPRQGHAHDSSKLVAVVAAHPPTLAQREGEQGKLILGEGKGEGTEAAGAEAVAGQVDVLDAPALLQPLQQLRHPLRAQLVVRHVQRPQSGVGAEGGAERLCAHVRDGVGGEDKGGDGLVLDEESCDVQAAFVLEKCVGK
eukprot:763809-Hanusia_phi.AAC.3